MANYKSTDHRKTTNHQQPTTNPLSGSQTTHRPLITNSPTVLPPTHRLPTADSSIGPPLTHGPLNTNSPTLLTLLQSTTNPLTHQTYFNRVTIGPILSLINFNWSFGLSTVHYWNCKVIQKMVGKKNVPKLQFSYHSIWNLIS